MVCNQRFNWSPRTFKAEEDYSPGLEALKYNDSERNPSRRIRTDRFWIGLLGWTAKTSFREVWDSRIYCSIGLAGWKGTSCFRSPSRHFFSWSCRSFNVQIIWGRFLLQPLFQYTGDVKQLLKVNKKADFSLEGERYNNLSTYQYYFLE